MTGLSLHQTNATFLQKQQISKKYESTSQGKSRRSGEAPCTMTLAEQNSQRLLLKVNPTIKMSHKILN
jgi:hypothetical protein